MGVPKVRTAHQEACLNATDPLGANWSHNVVYWAGKGHWYTLRTTPGEQTYPAFKERYEALCERLKAGERFDIPLLECTSDTPGKPLSKSENLERLAELRATFEI